MDTHHLPQLSELSTFQNRELKATFFKIFGNSPPLNVSSEYLRGNIAWFYQMKHQGYDSEKLHKKLLASLSQDQSSTKRQFLEGTRLFREWQGTTYEVTVLEKGFLYKNKNYRSLSKIAQLITGTQWSGPRFFGVAS